MTLITGVPEKDPRGYPNPKFAHCKDVNGILHGYWETNAVNA